jgi:hypothetical protein
MEQIISFGEMAKYAEEHPELTSLEQVIDHFYPNHNVTISIVEENNELCK